MGELTLIVPIYNSAEHLPALLQSLFCGANIESVKWVLIDDASTDGSYEICSEKLAQFAPKLNASAVLLRNPRNLGVAATRNRGLELTDSEYVGFLDADDVVFSDYGKTILATLERLQPEVLQFDYVEFHDTLPCHQRNPVLEELIRLCPHNRRHRVLFTHGFFVWNRIYKRQLIGTKRFQEAVRYYEDLSFTADVIADAESVYCLSLPCVGYRQHKRSATAVRDHRYTHQLVQFTAAMRRNREKFGASLDMEYCFLRKLLIILVKGIKIRPTRDRVEFYRQAKNLFLPGDPQLSRLVTILSLCMANVVASVARISSSAHRD